MSSSSFSYRAAVLVPGDSEGGAESGAEFVRARTVEHGGKTFAVVKAGQRFKVEAEIKGSGASLFNASLTVDGKSVGYSKSLIRTPKRAVFDGWFAGQGKRTEFIFQSAVSNATISGTISSPSALQHQLQSLGVVEVTFTRRLQVTCANRQGKKGMSSKTPSCKKCESHAKWFYGNGVPEAKGESHVESRPSLLAHGSPSDDKKFFLKPSLKASSSGRVCSTSTFVPSTHLVRHPGSYPVVIRIHCETAQILSLRRVLPGLPVVDAVGERRSRQSALARAQSPSSAQAGARGRVKRERSPLRGSRQAAVVNGPGAAGGSGAEADPLAIDQEGGRGPMASPNIRRLPPVTRPKQEGLEIITILDNDDDAEEGLPAAEQRKQRRKKNVVQDVSSGQPSLWMWEEDRKVAVVDLE